MRSLKLQIKALRRELCRTKRALAEASALLALSQTKGGLSLGGRGRRHGPLERKAALSLIERAILGGARLQAACRLVGLSVRTVRRWRKPDACEDRRAARRDASRNRLSDDERRRVLALVASDEYRYLSPRQIVPRLADNGIYAASESTIYRLLRRSQSGASRLARATAAAERHPSALRVVASAPNQVWSWDISYLKGPARGAWLYLYMIMDIFSRRVMGWQVHEEEAMELASRFIRTTCEESGVDWRGLVLRSDNGGPMKGSTTLATLRSLGVVPSFSRPRVSDDNPFSEALFRTLKRRPMYPGRFRSIEEARAWVAGFVSWYNGEHLHGGIHFVTPDDRHYGREASILACRQSLYERAQRATPGRFARGVRSWTPAGPVWLRAAPAAP